MCKLAAINGVQHVRYVFGGCVFQHGSAAVEFNGLKHGAHICGV